jgi:hypothetical protein
MDFRSKSNPAHSQAIPKEWDRFRFTHHPYASFKWPKPKGIKSRQGIASDSYAAGAAKHKD